MDELITDLLQSAAPAGLTTYRRDGSAVGSPVWFRAHDGRVEVVIAEGDVKLRHLRRDPRCSLLVFEADPPFRGVRVEGLPSFETEGVAEARLAISSRYLGSEDGRRFTEQRGPGVVLSLPLTEARSWDLRRILP